MWWGQPGATTLAILAMPYHSNAIRNFRNLNEESLLRLVSAVLSEINEEWQPGKVYLSMEAE
jgi:hypothetical protein